MDKWSICKCPVKRRALKLLVFLLAGAIINVAVAWTIAYLVRFDSRLIGQSQRQDVFTGSGASPEERERFRGYFAGRDAGFGSLRVSVSKSFSWGLTQRSTTSFVDLIPPWSKQFFEIPELTGGTAAWNSSLYTHDNVVDARGWPFLSLWGGLRTPKRGRQAFRDGIPIQLTTESCWAIVLDEGTSAPDGEWLPLRPLFPGFAINTIFYAAVLWVLFAVPGRVRRWRRIKRGVCVHCAYPVGSSSVCSECGTAVHGASPPATPA